MNCAACQNKLPSAGQVSHMQAGGCLYNKEFRDYGNELTDAVYSVIEADDLIALYTRFSRSWMFHIPVQH